MVKYCSSAGLLLGHAVIPNCGTGLFAAGAEVGRDVYATSPPQRPNWAVLNRLLLPILPFLAGRIEVPIFSAPHRLAAGDGDHRSQDVAGVIAGEQNKDRGNFLLLELGVFIGTCSPKCLTFSRVA